MNAKPLPPFGKQWRDSPPSAGLCVAYGPNAWNYSKAKPFPVLVLPSDQKPTDFRWPSHPGGAVIFERGDYNDDCLTALATELLSAGSPFVVAIREALTGSDPRTFFYPEVESAAA